MRHALISILLFAATHAYAADGYHYTTGGTLGIMSSAAASGTNSILEYSISNTVARGATTVFVDRPFTPALSLIGYVAFSAYATNCEVRQLSGVTSHQLSFNTPLAHGHNAGERVFFFYGPSLPVVWFGARSDSAINAGWALLKAASQNRHAGDFKRMSELMEPDH